MSASGCATSACASDPCNPDHLRAGRLSGPRLRGNEQRNFLDKSAKDLAGNDAQTLVDLQRYLAYRRKRVDELMNSMRTEKDAKNACDEKGIKHGITKTKNQTHHQSSKSTVSLVDHITKDVCASLGVDCDTKPHSRCYWKDDCGQLHVTVRNLDGAVPKPANPFIVWEIKEYWGSSKGGSKMSDAVYECELVGKEIRDFELKLNKKIYHIVFLDGKNQWESRQSDLARFVDLESQGIIDYLIVGKEIESKWEKAALRRSSQARAPCVRGRRRMWRRVGTPARGQ